MKYAIVIEKGKRNYSAYAPDLPGCVSAADTLEETKKLMAEAIEFHLEAMVLYDEPIPGATSQVGELEIDVVALKQRVQRQKKRAAKSAVKNGRAAAPK